MTSLLAPRSTPTTITPTTLNLLIALLVLVIISLLLIASLLYLRSARQNHASSPLPLYNEKRISTTSTSSHHRRVMVRPAESIYVVQEKQGSLHSPPASPVPEIRITFPEEVDTAGKRISGRVVVVRVGETSIGLEPVGDTLPSYEKDGERFVSLDLDRIGGLTEKNFS